MTANSQYPGFDYPAQNLSKFLGVLDFFTIMLKDGSIIHFKPDDANSFRHWLLLNKVIDMRTEKGWVTS
ncbi:MAG TPA: hypothetical protein PLC18_00860 [Sediminibacterium sp.]|jgi:hypothetical protein|uniref:hypothetical protein n=1 Tax=Chitinophagaceae TaxID=563835 RepID=UPI001025EADD|nr:MULTISPECIES: hypothetical protein [Chitinophagaceae]RWZ89469.1 MAG: hypothetical protein EO766_04550 [Hydrotalea sp. AMD]HQS22895.1 hypothetical protein [Sediminibacterium sp.]HQS33928.1 hypothetical protein [Sediminibacterium sp.]